MATFQPFNQSTLNATADRDSFSQILDSDFALRTPKESAYNDKRSAESDLFSKGIFDDSSLTIDTRFMDSPLLQTQPEPDNTLKSQFPHSPPDSATISPKQWPVIGHQPFRTDTINNGQSIPTAYNLYGQMTPPDDNHEQFHGAGAEGDAYQVAPTPSNAADQQRFDMNTTDTQPRLKSKRSRKNAGRGSKKHTGDSTDPNDQRRTKFLERNRVAASKCRQKKKEWTQNLEGKARELQSENHNLRLWMDSLRDEYMYLKTQVAEHRSCNNRAINEFLDDPKRDHLALNNPAARSLLENMSRHSIKVESDDEGLRDSSGSISDDQDALEALLTDSINEATAD